MYITVKRLLDILSSFILLVLLFPLIILISVIIKTTSKGPVFFKQKRIGMKKREFEIYKFRSMKISAPSDVPTHLLKDPNQHVTLVGKYLRLTSLDELPQLWNILIGEMSFVGPRPALWNQMDLVNLRDKVNANKIKPGLTGWAQVNGRDNISMEKKVQFDGEYVELISFKLDLLCIYKTLSLLLKNEKVESTQNSIS